LAAAARVLRAHAERVELTQEGVLLDTCGTGGDGLGTFNISTATALVVAAAGVRVAKHGNRAVSSRAGSADVLEALGVRIDLPPARVRACVEQLGIGFLYAPAHHMALRHAAPVRRELSLRTFFNLLGPLANPAGATHQLVGVYAEDRVEIVAEVLRLLGTARAWVVHGEGGLDEVSPLGRSRVAKVDAEGVSLDWVEPRAFGLEPASAEELRGGDAAENAEIIRAIYAGEPGGRRTAVLMNAASALVIAGLSEELAEATRIAADAIDSGEVSRRLEAWIRLSQET
jgi:anthranilate phosphoribosyltransferase